MILETFLLIKTKRVVLKFSKLFILPLSNKKKFVTKLIFLLPRKGTFISMEVFFFTFHIRTLKKMLNVEKVV